MLLILGGMLSLIVEVVNSAWDSIPPNDYCVMRNTHCDPNLTRPCCNPVDICNQTEPNSFECIENVGLGKFCMLDQDCDEIRHSKCSKDNKCICRTHNIEVNKITCAPVLGGFCWKNELCATNNAVCIDSECQCNVSNYRRLNDQCIFDALGTPCESNKNCERVKFAKCSEHKICSCSANTFAVNQHHCAPLIGGFCWTTNDCLPPNSTCVNNSCKCIDFYVSQSNNQCIPVHLGMSCSTDKECNKWIPHSICTRNQCTCDKDYLATDRITCASSTKIPCSSKYPCTMDHSLCKDNLCQCESKFVYQSSKCIPLYLNESCESDNDCYQILNARCSADNICVCHKNHIEFNKRACRPVLRQHCLKDGDCIAVNTICIMNECQCKPHFVRKSTNLCALAQLGMDCKDNNDCIDILYSECSVNKKCECMSNYVQYNSTTCRPLLGGYCSESRQCETLNSTCSNNICVCSDGLMKVSNNKCTSHFIGNHCMINEDCEEIQGSICVNNSCDCDDNYDILNATACALVLGAYCKNNQDCAPANSICYENECQCDFDYEPRFNNLCIPKTGYLKISCNNDYDCVSIKYAKCSTHQKCVCQSSYVTLGNEKCIALIGEYCDSDEECISYKTVCVNNKCQCSPKLIMRTKFQCDRVSLGRICHKDDGCDAKIKNTVCSKDNICVCRENYYALNRFECVPFLNEYCSDNDECRFNSSICVGNKCQCKHNFQSVSASQCQPIDYIYACNEDFDCGDPWHIKCFPDRKCRCNSNNISINRSTCLPLLKGYCWRDSQCFVPNSACIDFQCKCKKNFMPVSGNLCLPV